MKKKFISNNTVTSDFIQTMKRGATNTVNIDQCIREVDYNNPEIPFADKSTLGLKLRVNVLLEYYLDILIKTSEVLYLNEAQRLRYTKDCRRLAIDRFGDRSYEYLIYAVNNIKPERWDVPDEMVLVPDKYVVTGILESLITAGRID